MKSDAISKYLAKLDKWILQVIQKTGKTNFVLGISGGIDSAVIAFWLRRIETINLHLYYIPVNSSKASRTNAKLVFDTLGLKFREIDLTDQFIEMNLVVKNVVGIDHKLASENMKPRMRMISLYYAAQAHDGLVVGTGNFTEYYLGYFTKHGDGAADLYPLVNLTKDEVRALAKELNVPNQLILQAPSADLYEGQSDEADFGFTYEEVDSYLNGNDDISKTTIVKIERFHSSAMHKYPSNSIKTPKLNAKRKLK